MYIPETKFVDDCGAKNFRIRYGGIHRSSASPRPPCDGTPASTIMEIINDDSGLRLAIVQADADTSCPYP